MAFEGAFRGERFFLSNFSPVPGGIVGEDGIRYPTTEHYFMAHKTHNMQLRRRIASCPTPGEAKREGRKLILREDWESVKDQVMKDALALKFPHGSKLGQKLLATGTEHLVETNNWHDNIWGVCSCPRHCCQGKGENRLGIFLMEQREKLRRWEGETLYAKRCEDEVQLQKDLLDEDSDMS